MASASGVGCDDPHATTATQMSRHMTAENSVFRTIRLLIDRIDHLDYSTSVGMVKCRESDEEAMSTEVSG